MSVINGQKANATTFNSAFTSKTATDGNELTGNLEVVDTYIYFGRQDVNGSFRVGIASGELSIEKRVAGAWEQVGAFSE